jgi:succinate dehydrogenase/fumarate reductase flavoprotein subunit
MEPDLLVLGGGMAGSAAAARAAQDGASVVLVEKAAATGGSAAYAGLIWTAPSVEVMREVNPDADPALSAAVVDGWAPAVEWVRALGVEVGTPVTVLGFGRGCPTDIPGLLMTCARVVREADGCEVLVGTRTERLLVEDGAVRGAELVGPDGERHTVRARETLLATGGFGGDAELRARHIHPQARDMPLRANPHSVGDGLRLGRAAGGSFASEDAGFYGHVIPARIAYDDPLEFVDLTFYHSEHGVLVNLDGRRFCDETIGDHVTPLSLVEQPEARALLVYDERVRAEWELRPYVDGFEAPDKFQLAYRRGARCAVAEALEEFAELPEEWGYDGPRVLAALREFNRQCEAGEPSPPRANDGAPLVTPPYYVIEVVPAITFTFGGLRIDPHARVLDEGGEPIPGLLAAGADSGGVFHRGYAGGIANALVFGLRAAETALSQSGRASSRSSARAAS